MKKILCSGLLCGMMLASCLSGCQKKVDLSNEEIINFTAPEIGEEIVVMTIKDYGDIKIKLFEDECPKGVENFKALVNSGYYDELTFHRVISEFIIQSGDPTATGMGGESSWGEGFEQEISKKLCHFNGALAYAVASDKLNGSQFYFVSGSATTQEYFDYLANNYDISFTDKVKEMYYEYGGSPSLDGGYEIFGQVFDGLELIQAIDDVSTDTNDKPYDGVYIEKAVVTTYQGDAINWKGKELNLPELEDVDVLNFTAPVKGEEVVEITFKGFGTVSAKLFPEECPKGVENFLTHAKEGYYDGLTCHRVIEDFVVQGGDPTGSGSGGESIWGDGFAQEINSGLIHTTGALAYAVASDKLNNSQFYIVSGKTLTQDYFDTLESRYNMRFAPNIIDLYLEKGGQPYLDGGYEVFGQVYSGLDVIDAVQKVETDDNDKPVEDVIIESVKVIEYEEK